MDRGRSGVWTVNSLAQHHLRCQAYHIRCCRLPSVNWYEPWQGTGRNQGRGLVGVLTVDV
jgi:hypothetical protein